MIARSIHRALRFGLLAAALANLGAGTATPKPPAECNASVYPSTAGIRNAAFAGVVKELAVAKDDPSRITVVLEGGTGRQSFGLYMCNRPSAGVLN
jgi:hypothetical protein